MSPPRVCVPPSDTNIGWVVTSAAHLTTQVPFPRISLSFTCALCVLHERDDSVARLGGEATKALADRAMGAKAFNFFSKE